MPYGRNWSAPGWRAYAVCPSPGQRIRKAHVNDTALLRAACEARLDALQLPWPLDLDAVVRIVGERIGRSVEVVEAADQDASGALSGVALLVGDDRAYVAYDRELVGLHRTQVILHELAHLLCGHRALSIEELERGDAARHGYRWADEAEAEMLASLMYVRCTAPQFGPGHGGNEVTRRFSSLLFPQCRTRRKRR